jgi:hypothetical protein
MTLDLFDPTDDGPSRWFVDLDRASGAKRYAPA